MKSCKITALAAWLWLATSGAWGQAKTTPAPPPDAAETQREIRLIENLLPNLRDRGPALFQLAHDYAHLGDLQKAQSLLEECMEMHEGFDPADDSAFSPVKDQTFFRKLLEDLHRRYPPVHRAQPAFTVAEKDLIPEGMAANPATGTLFMGSLNRRKIVEIAKNGQVSDFTQAGQDNFGPICGLKVDPATEGVWAAVCRDSGTSAELLHFDKAGKLAEHFPATGPGPHLFNDLVLTKDAVFVTDSLAHRAYRLDLSSHNFTEVALPRPMYYPNGIALSDDGRFLYVADAFGILQVDLKDGTRQEVDPGKLNTVSGADGLYWYHNSLIAVQNSLGKSRVAQFQLSPDGLRVTATTVLEYATSSVELPTTGAILGKTFYFMANTQLDNFKDEKVLDPSKLKPIRIVAVRLAN